MLHLPKQMEIFSFIIRGKHRINFLFFREKLIPDNDNKKLCDSEWFEYVL